MYRNQLASKSLGLCLVLSLLATPLFAADLATVQMGSTGVSWQPAADAASWVLTVSGPDGYYVRQEFDSAPSMGLFTEDGQFLQDGLYTYELQAIPRVSSALRQQLDAAAGDLDLRERLAARVEGLGGVQSGHFRISQGALVQGDQVELPASGGGAVTPLGDFAVGQTVPEGGLDHLQVINMDLLVNGSICVGFDCGSSQSFGADTLRLRENNLRIHFDDTSNSASFPSNDWRLIANDSTNGGANKFVIQDATSSREVFTIEAGTISNALYVDSAGDVGIGTSSPVVEVHAVDGNTPALRLEQNGSSGFTSQTWDLAGNEVNFFVRDVTNGSKLPFRIRPGAPDSSIDIAGDGDVGVGTSSPAASLHVRRSASEVRVESTGTSGSDHASVVVKQSGASTTSEFEIRANATTGALEVKDSTAGGSALKFQQGAANNSIVVGTADSGNVRVGIGTTTPQGNAGDNSLDVNGAIFQRGGQLHADYVFEPDYKLESIEEHASYMWEKKHLPAIPPRQVDEQGREVVELGSHRRGIVEELEKAHIYIEQLHSAITEKGRKFDAIEKKTFEILREKDQRIETLEARLEELETLLVRDTDH